MIHEVGQSNESVRSLTACAFDMQTLLVIAPNFPNLKVFRIRLAEIKTISKDYFKSLKELYYLKLDTNKLQQIAEDSFDDLEQLEELSLKFNLIGNIHRDTFKNLKLLKRLQLSGNKLITLRAGLFRNNKNMEEIYLNRNQLTYLPPNLFDELTKARVIDVSENICVDLKLQIDYDNQTDQLTKSLNECFEFFEALPMDKLKLKAKQAKLKARFFDDFLFKIFFGIWTF